MVRKQKMGELWLIVMCILINMLSPMSTNIYLPALNAVCSDLSVSASTAATTVSIFMIFFAIGTLFGGPLCDKYGRKGILLGGSVMYLLGNVLCLVAGGVTVLMLGRVISGIGAGAITSVSFAIIKDCFTGEKCERIITIVQSIAGLGPVVSPVIGAVILQFMHWRKIFIVLIIVAVFNLALNLIFEESLERRSSAKGSIWQALGGLVTVARNKSIFYPLVIFALASFSNLGYVGVSSYIFITDFGTTEQAYSMYYAISSLIAIAGPLIYAAFFLKVNKNFMTIVLLAALSACGLFMALAAPRSMMLFLVLATGVLLLCSIIRPFSMNILFAQSSEDTGSISSLYNAINFGLGSVGMTVCAMDFGNRIVSLGIIIAAVSVLELVLWLGLMRSSIPCAGVKKQQE